MHPEYFLDALGIPRRSTEVHSEIVIIEMACLCSLVLETYIGIKRVLMVLRNLSRLYCILNHFPSLHVFS